MAADFIRGLQHPPTYKCCICMEFYGSEPSTRGILEHAIELPCKHIVGSECIEMWLSPDFANRNTCPVCRYELFPGQPRPYLEHGILGDDDSGSEDHDDDDLGSEGHVDDDMYPDGEDSDSNDDEEEEDQEEEEGEEDEDEDDKEMADGEEDEEDYKEMAEEDDLMEEQEEERQQIQPRERLPGGESVQLDHGRWQQQQHEHREEHQRHVFHTEEYRLDTNTHRLPTQQLQQRKQLYQPHVRGHDQPLHHYLPPQLQQPGIQHRYWYHRELQLHHHRQQQQTSNEEGQSQDEVRIDPDNGRSITGEITKDTWDNEILPKRVQEWEEAVMAYLLDHEAEMGASEAVKLLNRSRDQLLYMQLVDVTHPNPVTAQGIAYLSIEQEDELFKALDERGAFQDLVNGMPDLSSNRDLWNALRQRGYNYYNVCDGAEEVYRDEWRLSSESTSWECLYGFVRSHN